MYGLIGISTAVVVVCGIVYGGILQSLMISLLLVFLFIVGLIASWKDIVLFGSVVSGGYAVLTLPEDGSRWVLRLGDEGDRYVHVHPGRWSPETRRVRANVLKTAVMVLAYTGLHGRNPTELRLVNSVRRRYLGLAPMGQELSGEQGLGAVIDVLRVGAAI